MIIKRNGRSTEHRSRQVDVLVIGAGISGIGIAHHLKCERPGTSFAILEAREEIGGTWSLFRYPGIRSDSDMPTFGYSFKPWTSPLSIAEGPYILEYLRKTAEECGIRERIRFGHKVVAADFDTGSGLWTVTVHRTGSRRPATFTSRFLFLSTGYYDYESAFVPDFEGIGEFKGRVVHPQFWPDDLVYTDKRVVVIGSGATAVTLIPSMTPLAKHVTMLQRSPSYVLSAPAVDVTTHLLNKVVGPERAHRISRRKNIALGRGLFKASKLAPGLMRKLFIAQVRAQLPKHFDVDTHFTPRYNPWEQRLCMVPNGDLFKAISSGKASVMTDHIDRFTENGILLRSGQELAADVVVTATGLNMLPFGKITLSVDGQQAHLPDLVAFKAMMLSGIPNLAYAVGYSNLSWTLKVELVAEHFCRLLDHMKAFGYDTVVPVLDNPGMERFPILDLQAGYVNRGIGAFPRAGDEGSWTLEHVYEKDVERLRRGPVDDPALHFTTVRKPAFARAGSR
ncbi:flavin-containing monooxygenase [Nocardia sp. NPDC059239]|uniref:flavin-containing monooxygenase n=1 Tax=unclassified Nocardia TaxID=2637762 RepID=UPI0036BBAF12